jgi:hypothetical protein
LGAVSLSTSSTGVSKGKTSKKNKGRQWVRQKRGRPRSQPTETTIGSDLGKRPLVDVTIAEGTMDDIKGGEKKHKGDTVMQDCGANAKMVVLEDQHHPQL